MNVSTLNLYPSTMYDFRFRNIFHGLPGAMRSRSCAHAWANTRADVKKHLGAKVEEGDIKTHVANLDSVMAAVVKGHGQKVVVEIRIPNGPIWTRDYVLRHHKRPAVPVNGRLTCQQVMDAIRRVPDFVPEIGGYASVVDFIALITQKTDQFASKFWADLVPFLKEKWQENEDDDRIEAVRPVDYLYSVNDDTFPAQGAHRHPVARFETLVHIVPYIRSRNAADLHAQITRCFCRNFGGDQTLHAEIDAAQTSLRSEDRRDVLRGIDEDTMSSDTCVSHSFADRSALAPNNALTAPWIPYNILKSPGGYLGTLGEEMLSDRPGARLKAGEAQMIEKRWSASSGGHAASAPYSVLLWGASPINPKCIADARKNVDSVRSPHSPTFLGVLCMMSNKTNLHFANHHHGRPARLQRNVRLCDPKSV